MRFVVSITDRPDIMLN